MENDTRNFLLKVGVSVVVLYLVYKAIDTFFHGKENEQKEASKGTVEATKKALETETSKKRYSDVQYKAFADKLYSGIYEPSVGVDHDKIYDVFYKIHTDNDFLNLVDAYGIRVDARSFHSGEYNLIDTLNKFCGTKTLSEINRILRSNKVKYKV